MRLNTTQIIDIISSISERPFKKNLMIFLNTGDIEKGNFLHRSYTLVKNHPGQAKKAIYKGDILFSEIKPKNERYALVDFNSSQYVVSTKFMVIRSEKLLPYR